MRPRLVQVTPVMPHPTGGGLAMRAATTLAALTRFFDVELFVLPVAGPADPPSDFALRHAARVHVLDLDGRLDPYTALTARLRDPAERSAAEERNVKPLLSRYCTPDTARALFDWSGPPPAALHVMRLYLAPLAEPFLRLKGPQRPLCMLDLDDDEVLTRRRLADLHRAGGNHEAGAQETLEAARYATLAERAFPAFDRVAVCSAADAHRLGRQHPRARFGVLPNGSPGSAVAPRGPRNDGPLRLLFVGSLDYFPNADAVRFLCSTVREAIRRRWNRPIEIDIVGRGGADLRDAFAGECDMTFHGFVEDLRPHYHAADMAVVPIRAGGGTRIKILEAFAHRVPVVGTTMGAEGTEAVDGVHLLTADTAHDIAQACLRLKSDPALAEALSGQAAALCAKRYGAPAIEQAVAALYRPVIDPR